MQRKKRGFIDNAVKKLIQAANDAETKFSEYVRQRNKWEHDYYAGIRQAKHSSYAKGRTKGKAEERQAIASKMKKLGYSDEEISRLINS